MFIIAGKVSMTPDRWRIHSYSVGKTVNYKKGRSNILRIFSFAVSRANCELPSRWYKETADNVLDTISIICRPYPRHGSELVVSRCLRCWRTSFKRNDWVIITARNTLLFPKRSCKCFFFYVRRGYIIVYEIFRITTNRNMHEKRYPNKNSNDLKYGER